MLVKRLEFESDVSSGVKYEIKERGVIITATDGRHRTINRTVRFNELEQLAYEFLDICDAWRDIRT